MLPPDPRILQEDAKPERIHWLAWAVVAVGVAALVFFAIVPGVRMKMRDAAFRQVAENDTEKRVIEILGEPAPLRLSVSGDLHRWWGDEANPAVRAEDIDHALVWRVHFLTGNVWWWVGFDNQSRAIAKHRYD